MSTLHFSQSDVRKIEGMRTQQALLHMLEGRHLIWRSDINDPEIRRIHLEIADLIQKTTKQYDLLLAIYQHHA